MKRSLAILNDYDGTMNGSAYRIDAGNVDAARAGSTQRSSSGPGDVDAQC